MAFSLLAYVQFLPPPTRLCFRRCLSVCPSVCVLATLRKNFQTDLHEIFREGWQWASEQMIEFLQAIRIRDPDLRIWTRIRIATLVRRGTLCWSSDQ